MDIEVNHTAKILDIKHGDSIYNGSYLGSRVTIIKEDYEDVLEKHVIADHVLRIQAYSGMYVIKDSYACTFHEFLNIQKKKDDDKKKGDDKKKKDDDYWDNIHCTHDEKEVLKTIHIRSLSDPKRHSKDSVKLLSDIVLGLAELKANQLCHGNLNAHSIVLCVIEGQVRAKLTQLRPRVTNNKRIKSDYEHIGMLIQQMFGKEDKSYEVEDLRRHINKQQVLYGSDNGVIDRSPWKCFQKTAEDAFEEDPRTLFKHPFFYTDQQSLTFMVYLYAVVKKCNHHPVTQAFSDINTFLKLLNGIRRSEWVSLLDMCVQNELTYKGTTYVDDKVADLVKFIRHMANHIEEKSNKFQTLVGEIPDGYFEYFRSRYPSLLLEAQKILQFSFGNIQKVLQFNYKFKEFLLAPK